MTWRGMWHEWRVACLTFLTHSLHSDSIFQIPPSTDRPLSAVLGNSLTQQLFVCEGALSQIAQWPCSILRWNRSAAVPNIWRRMFFGCWTFFTESYAFEKFNSRWNTTETLLNQRECGPVWKIMTNFTMHFLATALEIGVPLQPWFWFAQKLCRGRA